MSHGRFKNPVQATLTGILDIFRKQKLSKKLSNQDNLNGKTCLVTGANSGLGFGIATQFAERGARVIMACRSGIPEAGGKVKEITGSDKVEMIRLDLTDLDSINDFIDELKRRNISIDVLVANAGIAPPKARKTQSGMEEMFMVNYLSKNIYINLLLREGIIKSDFYGTKNGSTVIPRIIYISSDSHQNASAVDYEEFGIYKDYGVKKAINNYSYYKLVMNTFATELSRRINKKNVDVAVNVICPGPVNSNIIRDAPFLLRFLLKLIFSLFFPSAYKAASPVTYMACSKDFEGKTNEYLHMFNPKRMDAKVYDEKEGKKLWKYSDEVWKKIDPKYREYDLNQSAAN